MIVSADGLELDKTVEHYLGRWVSVRRRFFLIQGDIPIDRPSYSGRDPCLL